MKVPITRKKTATLPSRRFVMAWAALMVVGATALAAEPAAGGASPPGIEYRRLLEAGPQSIHVV